MTDAKITDLAEYRARRNGVNEQAYFATWSDRHIWTRQNMLVLMKRDGVDPADPAFKFVFKDGYDPVNHLGDNLEALQREAARRGVEVTSAV